MINNVLKLGNEKYRVYRFKNEKVEMIKNPVKFNINSFKGKIVYTEQSIYCIPDEYICIITKDLETC